MAAVKRYFHLCCHILLTVHDIVVCTKAPAAAERLAAIFPGVVTKGIAMTIPMPGHPVDATALPASLAALEQLQQLITDHDAVFLLTDSREARWLPTVN